MTSVDTTIQRITNGRAPGEVCTTDLREAPWAFDTGAGPAASDRPATTTALQRTNP